MADSLEPNLSPDAEEGVSLDQAIEFCVERLESRGTVDPDELIEKFPQWTEEIAEFLENWGGMEQFANVFIDPAEPLFTTNESGTQFDDYELLEKIGVGGMGVIYKARQISLDRVVAVKMISGEHRDGDRFKVETETAGALNHPNIVPIYETGENKGRLFFSMRLINGGNLKEYINQGPVPQKEAARIAETIARAVNHAHEHGILHRDLKPANVLMDENGQPHITDFGLAKQIARGSDITYSGTIVGTPGYMAPEQASGKSKYLTTATDVYGVGAILYALLCGDAPFHGDSSLDVLRRVVDEQPSPPRYQRPSVDRDLETICLKCLEKEPKRRYTSASLLAEDLSRYLHDRPVKARPVMPAERILRWCRRNPAIALLSGAVVLLMLISTTSSLFLASSERNARMQAESNSRRESALREKADSARQQQERARKVAIQSQAELCVANGFWRSQQANLGEAVLWFADAARLTQNDPEKSHANLLRYENWLRQQPVPVSAIYLKQGYEEVESTAATEKISFRPNATQLLCEAGSQFVLWDYATHKGWNLHDEFPDVTSAEWSPNGEVLAVGSATGKLILLDPATRTVQNEFELEEPVLHIRVSGSGRYVAAGSRTGVQLWDLSTGELLAPKLTFQNRVAHIEFDLPSEQLVIAIRKSEQSGVARLYEIALGKLEFRFEVPCRVDRDSEGRQAFWPQFVDDGRQLVIRQSQANPDAIVWLSTETGEPERSVPLETHKFSIKVSSKGNEVVAGDIRSVDVHRFDPAQAKEIRTSETSADANITPTYQSFADARDDRVNALDINQHGLIAAGGWDRTVQLIRLADSYWGDKSKEILERRAVLPHQSRVRKVVFSPDGRHLVTSQRDGLVRIWELPSEELAGQSIPVPFGSSLARVIDEKRWLLSGMSRSSGRVSTAKIFDYDTGEQVGGSYRSKLEADGPIMDSYYLQDANQLVTLHASPNRSRKSYQATDGSAGSVRIWDASTGASKGEPLPLPCEPRWVEQHPHKPEIAVGMADMSVALIRVQPFELKVVLYPELIPQVKSEQDSHPDNVASRHANESDLNDDDPTAVRGGSASNRFLPRGRYYPTHRRNQQVTYSPNGELLAVWSTGQSGVWVWDLNSGQVKYHRFENERWPLSSVEFSPDSQLMVVSGGRNNTINVLEAETGRPRIPELKQTSVTYRARFSPDGKRFVVACRDGLARVFETKTGNLLFRKMSHKSDVLDATFTPDSRFILTLGYNSLSIWHNSDGSLAMKTIATPPRARQIQVSMNSQHVIVAGGQNEVIVLDLERLSQLPACSLSQMKRYSELISNKSIVKGTVIDISTPQWISRWNKYQASLAAPSDEGKRSDSE